MWELISSRSHHPVKIFPFGEISDGSAEAEVMIHGTVDYGFKAGGRERKEWAARVEMVRGEGGWKMRLYQVYLVSVISFCVLWGVGIYLGTWELMLRWIGYGSEEIGGFC